MNSKLLALASVLVATTAAASVAEAGGGVRLGFGFPLGSFKATPSHGGGGGSYQAAKTKRKPPAQVHQAARKPEKSEPRVTKAETSKPAKTVAANAEKVEETTETTAPLTGSSALIEQSIPAQDQAKPEAAAEVKPEAATDGAVTASTDKASGDVNCKKFIPAVGMTVSVGCGE